MSAYLTVKLGCLHVACTDILTLLTAEGQPAGDELIGNDAS